MLARIAILFVALEILCRGALSSPASLARLIDAAELTLVGTITNVEINGTRVRFTVAADRVLSGGSPGAFVVAATVPRELLRTLQIARETNRPPRNRVLIFARKAGQEWELLPATSGHVTSITELIHELPSQYVVPALRASDGPDEAVARVFLGHLASKRPDSSEGWRARESLAYFARERKGRIPAALREFGTEALSSADLDTRALGISLSVMENSVSAPMLIDQAQSVLGEQRAETVIRHFRNNFSADETLAARAVIRLLGNARSENLKEACVRVLSRAHTRPVLPVLVEMLGSGNPQVRGVAVRGLADFANNVPPGKSQKAPGPWRYRTDETEARGAGDIERLAQPASIQFWRAWWERYGKELAE